MSKACHTSILVPTGTTERGGGRMAAWGAGYYEMEDGDWLFRFGFSRSLRYSSLFLSTNQLLGIKYHILHSTQLSVPCLCLVLDKMTN